MRCLLLILSLLLFVESTYAFSLIRDEKAIVQNLFIEKGGSSKKDIPTEAETYKKVQSISEPVFYFYTNGSDTNGNDMNRPDKQQYLDFLQHYEPSLYKNIVSPPPEDKCHHSSHHTH